MDPVDRQSLNEYLLEEREENLLSEIEKAFLKGDKHRLITKVKAAQRLIRTRERRITYRLISAAKREGLSVYGKPLDVFEKELLEHHKKLYGLLGDMVQDNEPVDLVVLESLIAQAKKIEEEIIGFVRGLILELKKN